MGTFSDRTRALAEALQKALARGNQAIVILPAYTLQRTQELVAELHYALCRQTEIEVRGEGQEPPRIYVDSPMARRHTESMLEEFRRTNKQGKRPFLNEKSPLFAGVNPGQIDSLLTAWFDPLHDYARYGNSWSLNYNQVDGTSITGPTIVITSSGNCLGGLVLRHLAQQLTNAQATVILTGYQPTGGPGDLLKKLRQVPREDRHSYKIKLGDSVINGQDVEAEVIDLSAYYSGHADEAGLVDFILRNDTDKATSPLTVFLNHGDGRARELLKSRLESIARSGEPGWRNLHKVFIPDAGKGWFDLATGEWLAEGSPFAGSEQTEEIMLLLREILDNQRQILAQLGGHGTSAIPLAGNMVED